MAPGVLGYPATIDVAAGGAHARNVVARRGIGPGAGVPRTDVGTGTGRLDRGRRAIGSEVKVIGRRLSRHGGATGTGTGEVDQRWPEAARVRPSDRHTPRYAIVY